MKTYKIAVVPDDGTGPEVIGETEAGTAIEASIPTTTPKVKSQLANQMGYTTTQIGDLVATSLQ